MGIKLSDIAVKEISNSISILLTSITECDEDCTSCSLSHSVPGYKTESGVGVTKCKIYSDISKMLQKEEVEC